jgi:hypothetical protein
MNRRSRIIEIRMNSRRHSHGLHRERRRWEECFRQVQQAGVRRRPRFAPGASGPPSRGHWWRWVPSTGSLSRFRRTTTYPAGPLTRTPPPSKRNHLDSLDHLLSRRDRNRRNPIRPAPQAAGASSEPPHMPRITWAQSADNSWWTMGVKLSNDGTPSGLARISRR